MRLHFYPLFKLRLIKKNSEGLTLANVLYGSDMKSFVGAMAILKEHRNARGLQWTSFGALPKMSCFAVTWSISQIKKIENGPVGQVLLFFNHLTLANEVSSSRIGIRNDILW